MKLCQKKEHCHFVENQGSGVYSVGGDDDEPGGGLNLNSYMRTIYDDGGGIHISGDGEALVEDCLFDGNAGMNGTAVCVSSGKLAMDRCLFTRNIAGSVIQDYAGVISITGGGNYR